MRRLAAVVGLTVAGVSLAGCGTADPVDPGPDPELAMVGTGTAGNLGTVLVDGHGMVLYFSDQDSAGRVRCTGSCTSVWLPALASGGAAPAGAPPGVTVIRRPDTQEWQLAYRGRPLYEFRMDGMAGEVIGNGVRDRFGGTEFTWHVAAVVPAAH
jgi:predicted lipoprotein with Yx(FWY)xxD motif